MLRPVSATGPWIVQMPATRSWCYIVRVVWLIFILLYCMLVDKWMYSREFSPPLKQLAIGYDGIFVQKIDWAFLHPFSEKVFSSGCCANEQLPVVKAIARVTFFRDPVSVAGQECCGFAESVGQRAQKKIGEIESSLSPILTIRMIDCPIKDIIW